MSYVLTYFELQSSVSIKRIDEFLNSEDNLVPIQTPAGGFSGNNNGSGNGIRLLQPPPPSLSNNDERKDNLQVKSTTCYIYQVWSLTQFYSVDFSQSRISVKKCVFNKRTIKVCVSCC